MRTNFKALVDKSINDFLKIAEEFIPFELF